jgi:hypothetical protein
MNKKLIKYFESKINETSGLIYALKITADELNYPANKQFITDGIVVKDDAGFKIKDYTFVIEKDEFTNILYQPKEKFSLILNHKLNEELCNEKVDEFVLGKQKQEV